MSFTQKRVLSHAVMASSLLLLSQSALAVVNITTDLSNTVTVDAADNGPAGTNNTFIKASGGSIAVTAAGVDAVLVQPTVGGFTGTLTVEKSSTVRGVEISSAAAAVNVSSGVATTTVINVQQGATVRSTGSTPVINENSFAASIVTLNNDGNIVNTGTGKLFSSNFNSTNTVINNNVTGVMTAGANATAIELNVLANDAVVNNAGTINAPGGSAVSATGGATKVSNFTNSGNITGRGIVLNFTGKATPVNLNGGSVRSNLITSSAISTDGPVTVRGGSVFGKITTTAAGIGTLDITLPNTTDSFTTTGDIEDFANINVNKGTLVLNSNILKPTVAASNLNVFAGGSLVVNAPRVIPGVVTLSPGSVNNFDLTSTTASAQIQATTTIVINGAAINVTNNGNGYIADNTNFRLLVSPVIVAVAPAVVGDNATTFNAVNTGVYSYTFNTGIANEVSVLVRRRPLNTFGTGYASGLIGELGVALESIGRTGTTDAALLQVLGELGRLRTADAVSDALRQLVPATNNMEVQAAVNVTSQAMDVVSNRLNMARLSDDEQSGVAPIGYAAGSSVEGQALWGQLYANRANQRNIKGIYGYKADTVGFAFGGDAQVMDNLRLGFAFGAATTDLRNATRPRIKDDLKNYQATVYGSLDCGCHWFDGMISYSALRHRVSRPISFGAINTAARNKHRGAEWSSRLAMGKDMGRYAGWNVNPSAELNWNHVAEHAYRESGAGSLSLRVLPHNVNIVDLGAKVAFNRAVQTGVGVVTPSAYVGAAYDIYSRRDTVNANFTGGGPLFKVVGLEPTRLAFDFGAALSLASHQDGTLTVSYDVKKKRDYFSHSAFLTARYAL